MCAAPDRLTSRPHAALRGRSLRAGPGARGVIGVIGVIGSLAVAGCATSNLQTLWVDPTLAGFSLAHKTVYVACQATDLTVRHVCADQLAAQLLDAGATPVLAADSTHPADTAQPANRVMIDAARAAGASAVLNAIVVPDASVVSAGPSIGFGIGGFGGGYRGGGVGGGVGVSVPVGGGTVSTGYAANGALTEVPSGRLMWSAKATAQPASDVTRQLADLAKTLLDSARSAGLFKP
jgi:hypothetical protein